MSKIIQEILKTEINLMKDLHNTRESVSSSSVTVERNVYK
jgi:hypothetical protein